MANREFMPLTESANVRLALLLFNNYHFQSLISQCQTQRQGFFFPLVKNKFEPFSVFSDYMNDKWF